MSRIHSFRIACSDGYAFQRGLLLSLATAVGLCLLAGNAGAITSTWITDGNGNWTNAANWNNGVPTNAGDVAYVTNPITAARTITIDTNVTLGTLKIGTTNYAYLLSSGAGTITMDSGNASRAVLQAVGNQQNYGPSKVAMACDLEIDNNDGTYFNLTGTAFSGNHDVYINANNAVGTPYFGGSAPFVGNTFICYGVAMGGDFFGATTGGMRTVTMYSNANFRLNSGTGTIATNRVFVMGNGGGQFNLNGYTLTLPGKGQLSGSNTLTIYNSTASSGTTVLGGTNDGFTGQVVVNTAGVTLKLNTNGCINYSPVINLAIAGSMFNVTNKSAGYSIPAGQVLAGIGTNLGVIKVTDPAAKIHPGTYSLPGPVVAPGVMTVDGGLSFANNGIYAWELKQLKDDAVTSPATTTFSQINLVSGAANLSGGTLAINFNGVTAPTNATGFWSSNHVWTVLVATGAPSGMLTVSNGNYTNWIFQTQVSSNTLQLVYMRTPKAKGSAVLIK